MKALNLTGRKINLWTVLKIDDVKKLCDGQRYWICQCHCGIIQSVLGKYLRNETSKGCKRCAIKQIPYRPAYNRLNIKDFINKQYGSLTIIKEGNDKIIAGERKRTVLCKCECGNEKEIILHYMLSGKTRSCGCSFFSKDEYGYKKNRRKSYKNQQGYIKVYVPNHPNADKNEYVLEHVLVMSKYLNRAINKGETIHHKNGIKDDNRIENLELWASNHHYGQRIEDIVNHAKHILILYSGYENPSITIDYQI